jgi:hypothetical protein
VVTEANGERIVGRWEVPGFAPELQLGALVNGAYDADAEVVAGTIGTFKHRLSRGQVPNAVACTGTFVGRMSGTAVSNPATCELLYLAP